MSKRDLEHLLQNALHAGAERSERVRGIGTLRDAPAMNGVAHARRAEMEVVSKQDLQSMFDDFTQALRTQVRSEEARTETKRVRPKRRRRRNQQESNRPNGCRIEKNGGLASERPPPSTR
eukprot:2941727-Pyramimonas_sp.AAC.1